MFNTDLKRTISYIKIYKDDNGNVMKRLRMNTYVKVNSYGEGVHINKIN